MLIGDIAPGCTKDKLRNALVGTINDVSMDTIEKLISSVENRLLPVAQNSIGIKYGSTKKCLIYSGIFPNIFVYYGNRFFEKIEFFKERNKFSVRILARVSLDSFLDSSIWYIYVAKTLKLINYDLWIMTMPHRSITDYIVVSWNTAALIRFFERRCLWHCAAGFLRITSTTCSLTFNFSSARIKCFLAFTRKYLPQFRVSILWKNYELGRSSLKTQLKIEFLL